MKKRKKNKLIIDNFYFGDESENRDYINAMGDFDDNCPEIDLLKYIDENGEPTPDTKPSTYNSIVSQESPKSDMKSSAPSKKGQNIDEYSLAEKLVEKYDIGIYYEAYFIRINGLYEPLTRKNTLTALDNILSGEQIRQLTARIAEGVYQRVKSRPAVINNELKLPETQVLFKNGLFDILTGEEVSMTKNAFITVRINTNYKPWKYYETPVWDTFLDQCSGGIPAVKELLMTFVGYLLLPGAYAKNFFVLGTARNSGKSLLAGFIKELVSSNAICAIPIDDFRSDFVVSQVVGKSINFAMDIPAGSVSRKSIGTIKTLTGHDITTMNVKYEPPFSYENFAKLVFATNNMVTTQEYDEAFWDRMIIIPFVNSVPKKEQDSKLLDKLCEEKEGIVNNAFKYAAKLVENDYQFPYCPLSETMKIDWVSGVCAGLSSFVKFLCKLEEKAWYSTVDLHEAYCQWCYENGIEPANITLFTQTLRNTYKLESSRRSTNGNQRRGVLGIKLKDLNEEVLNYERN